MTLNLRHSYSPSRWKTWWRLEWWNSIEQLFASQWYCPIDKPGRDQMWLRSPKDQSILHVSMLDFKIWTKKIFFQPTHWIFSVQLNWPYLADVGDNGRFHEADAKSKQYQCNQHFVQCGRIIQQCPTSGHRYINKEHCSFATDRLCDPTGQNTTQRLKNIHNAPCEKMPTWFFFAVTRKQVKWFEPISYPATMPVPPLREESRLDLIHCFYRATQGWQRSEMLTISPNPAEANFSPSPPISIHFKYKLVVCLLFEKLKTLAWGRIVRNLLASAGATPFTTPLLIFVLTSSHSCERIEIEQFPGNNIKPKLFYYIISGSIDLEARPNFRYHIFS